MRRRALTGGAVACMLYLLLTAAWCWLIWHAPPQIVPNGDGGNVASIAAGWLDRVRFAGDPVLADAHTSRFYMALTVPMTMFLGSILGDLGSGYMVQIVPLLLLQLGGFHLLGMRLFSHHGFAAALALLTIPPVHLIDGGELWGMYDVPLTRTFATAALPWLLLLIVGSGATKHRISLVMAACGLCVYLHPVSAVALAAGSWLALAVDRPVATSWPKHIAGLGAGAVIFVLAAVPFMLIFFQGFPGGSLAAAGSEQALAASALRKAAGPHYFDVQLVLRNLSALSGMSGSLERRAIIWGGGAIAFALLPLLDARTRAPLRLLAAFLVGVVLSSIGISALDQWIAAQNGGTPFQIDLIRNVRFLVPLLMVPFMWLLAVAAARLGRASGVVIVAAFTITALWWHDYPTPISRVIEQPVRFLDAPDPVVAAASRLLVDVRALPAHSRILPLTYSNEARASIEQLGLAVRYAAFQPVVFLEKDVNLLSYSGSAATRQWMKVSEQVARLRHSSPDEATDGIQRLVDDLKADYVIVRDDIASIALLNALQAPGSVIAQEGPWRLIGIHSATPAWR